MVASNRTEQEVAWSRLARRNVLIYIGATSIVASLVLRSTVGGDFPLILGFVGGSATLSFFALQSLSRIDVKWVGVRRGMNLSIALWVAGTAIVSAFALENMYAPSNPTTIPVAILGIVVWLLGMVAWLYSLVRARGAFGSKMKPARSFYQILRKRE